MFVRLPWSPGNGVGSDSRPVHQPVILSGESLSLRVSGRIKGFGSESMPPTTEGGDPDPGRLRLARQSYCRMK